jgi:hypothetical protein
MKLQLQKEEIQKIVLGGIMLVVLLYTYFFVILTGLTKAEALAKKTLLELQPKIDASQKDIMALKALKEKKPAAQQTGDAVDALIPEGAPMAWFPPRIADFMKRHGVSHCTTRLTNEIKEQGIPGYKRLTWTVELPQVEFIPLSIALAGLENEEPLLEITTIQIEATRNDPQFQRVLMTVSNLVHE